MNLVTIYYTSAPDGICITGMNGSGTEVQIPAEIEGKPVTEIGAYAFAVTEESPLLETAEETNLIFEKSEAEQRKVPLAKRNGNALQRLYLPDTIKKIGAYAISGCTALTVLHLPEALEEISHHMLSGCISLQSLGLPATLRVIEEYAFYDCRNIQKLVLPQQLEKLGKYAFYNCRNMESINIPKTATDLGTGLFLNCDNLTYLTFGKCSHIGDLIAGLQQELHITIEFENNQIAKLLIPDFQYEYIEDTPARQFHQVNYGTGHLFRQCIGNSDIDFRRYDELFYLTRREDGASMVLILTMYRLEFPYRLEEKRKNDYLSYLREHFLWAASYYISRGNLSAIRHFADWGLILETNIDDLLKLSGEKKKTEITGFLLEYQHSHLQKKEKSFDL